MSAVAAATVTRDPAGQSPVLALTFAPVHLDDLPRVRTAFAEGHKHAPGADRMPWRYYKQYVVPELNAALAHADTELVGAYADAVLVGWIAFSRGRRVDTVHWVSVPNWFPVPHTACLGCEPPIFAPGAHVHQHQRNHHVGSCPLAHANRVPLRRRGIMTALFDATALQERLAYTFRGAKSDAATFDRTKSEQAERVTMDERLLPWLRGRGHHAAYVNWGEWLKWR